MGWSTRGGVVVGLVIAVVGVVAFFIPGPANRNAVFGVTTAVIGVLTLAFTARSAARSRRGPHV